MPLTSVPLPSILDMFFVLKNWTTTHNLACVTKVKIIPSVSLEFHELHHPHALGQRKTFQAVLLVNEFSPYVCYTRVIPPCTIQAKQRLGEQAQLLLGNFSDKLGAQSQCFSKDFLFMSVF